MALKLDLSIDSGGWGIANPTDIAAVLNSAAEVLLCHIAGDRTKAVRVIHASDCPRTHYERGLRGEYVIGLTATDRHWAQYAFQFGHELLHLVSNYDVDRSHEVQWVSECLAEVASLFVLGSMSHQWQIRPPYEAWRPFAYHLGEYLKDRLNEFQGEASGDTAREIILAHLQLLREHPYDRTLNGRIAARLLRAFRDDPSIWSTTQFLNLGETILGKTHHQHMREWCQHVPSVLRESTQRLAANLGYHDAGSHRFRLRSRTGA